MFATLRRPRVLFGVTKAQSLTLLGPLPQKMLGYGWEVSVVCDSSGTTATHDSENLNRYHLPMERTPKPLRDILALIRWCRLIKAITPDMVAVGTPKAGLLGLVAAFWAGVPLRIYQLRGLRLEGTSGPSRWILYGLERVTAKCATHIVAVSPSLRDQYISEKLAHPNKISVLGHGSSHGVNIDRFRPAESARDGSPAKLAPSSRPLAVGFVGRFSRDKGSQALLACHESLQNNGVEHHLWLVGPHEESRGRHQIDASESIIATGQVEDTAPFYSQFDVLALPTRREGFPNVVLEAAAAGIPTVTTNATGARDAVVHGETGFIVPMDDTAAFTAAVEVILLDSDMRREMGRRARAWVSMNFDERLVVQNNADFLLELWKNSLSI